MISDSPATLEMRPVRSISVEIFYKEVCELVEGPGEGVVRQREVVVVVGDADVPGIPHDEQHLASIKEVRREELQGKVSLDDSPFLHVVSSLQSVLFNACISKIVCREGRAFKAT